MLCFRASVIALCAVCGGVHSDCIGPVVRALRLCGRKCPCCYLHPPVQRLSCSPQSHISFVWDLRRPSDLTCPASFWGARHSISPETDAPPFCPLPAPQTIERSHMPRQLWERVRLKRNYAEALAQLVRGCEVALIFLTGTCAHCHLGCPVSRVAPRHKKTGDGSRIPSAIDCAPFPPFRTSTWSTGPSFWCTKTSSGSQRRVQPLSRYYITLLYHVTVSRYRITLCQGVHDALPSGSCLTLF